MCRRHIKATEMRTATAEGPYEGETVRLGTQHDGQAAQGIARHGHFPWWSLWLIWPLFGLVKWLVPALRAGIAAVAGTLSELPLLAAGPWPILLIVVGIMLLRRKR